MAWRGDGGARVDEPLVRWEVADGVATVVLDSPHNRNALSRRLLGDLAAAVDAATTHPDVRVIVLTASGTVFCSGADLKEQRAANEAGGQSQPITELPAIMTKLWACRQPVVLPMNGPARAGGVGLLASCDLVVAQHDVTFSFTEVRLGLVPAIITVPLLRRVAPQALHGLFLTAEVFSAEHARGIGLVDAVAAMGELDTEVARLVGMLLRGGPEALALTKQLVRRSGRSRPTRRSPTSPSCPPSGLLQQRAWRACSLSRRSVTRRGCARSSGRRSFMVQFTEEHHAFRKMVRDVVEREIAPYVDEWERAGIFPAHELFPKLGAVGLLGLEYDPAYGGQGADHLFTVILCEELARWGCGGVPMAIGVQTMMATPSLANFGSEELKQRYLVPAIRGELVCSIAVTEADAGSDVSAIRTRAVRDGDEWVINGSKLYITNGTQADWICLLARTSDVPRARATAGCRSSSCRPTAPGSGSPASSTSSVSAPPTPPSWSSRTSGSRWTTPSAPRAAASSSRCRSSSSSACSPRTPRWARSSALSTAPATTSSSARPSASRSSPTSTSPSGSPSCRRGRPAAPVQLRDCRVVHPR